jgi:carboxymethylenebutenolidase
MCFETTARPPLPPVAGGAAVRADRFELTAADGTRFSCFGAVFDEAGGPGIVVMPDVRGLHPFYEDLAVRFGSVGVHAAAIDYFGRTAGTSQRDEGFDHTPHVQQTKPEAIAADVAAVVAHLRSDEGGRAAAVFTVGFCFGGRQSFNQAARQQGLAGVIGFYGFVGRRDEADTEAPVVLAERYACPVLGLFGGADQHITPEQIRAFGQALDAAGVSNELETYEGAPHSFFDRTFDRFKDACDDAWRRMLAFIERNTATAS